MVYYENKIPTQSKWRLNFSRSRTIYPALLLKQSSLVGNRFVSTVTDVVIVVFLQCTLEGLFGLSFHYSTSSDAMCILIKIDVLNNLKAQFRI